LTAKGYVHLAGLPSTPRFRTRKPFSTVVLLHCLYVLILVCCLRTATLALPYLPQWMTSTFDVGKGTRWSVLDILLFLIGSTLSFVERRRLCSDSDTTRRAGADSWR
jgi:hypothetical protein